MCTSGIDGGEFNTLKTDGINYYHFFPIGKKDDCLVLKFKVKGHRDAHILLSSSLFPAKETPAYQIVLGAGLNTFSTIRRKQFTEDKVSTKSSESLLSPNEWREFWIRISGNKIQVGRKDKNAFMEWTDPQPLPIKYFSLAGYTDVSILWIFPVFKEVNFNL